MTYSYAISCWIEECVNLKKVIVNAIQTPDGTVLISKHGRDYVSHVDANGEKYFVDGGQSCLRTSVNNEPAKKLYKTLDDPFEDVRDYVFWGTRGKCGTKPLAFLAISEMETSHIENLLESEQRIDSWRRDCLKLELAYRAKNEVTD